MRITIIVSTYNRPDALSLCIRSIFKQSLLPNEIVIGDDGSGSETIELINNLKKESPVPLIHVWQEDEGFRLAASRNKAVAASSGDYIIEIDGDLILHKKFIEDHASFAEPDTFLKGGRVNLNNKITTKLCKSQKLKELNIFSAGLLRRSNAFRNIPLSKYLSTRYKKGRIAGLGCNMSFWKKDYISINGYDEFFEGWGGEDIDFAARMMASGIKKKHLKFSGIVYHLWHNDFYMQNKEKNFNYYEEQRVSKKTYCENGIDKYLIDK